MSALTISPEEVKRVKALGFLNNKGTDNFSGRIITVNGKITAKQQQVIAEAAEKFGNGNITFTTRLTIEVQGIPFDKIEELPLMSAQAGLITGEPVPWSVRSYPVRGQPVSTDRLIPLPCQKKFMRDFIWGITR